MGKSILLLGLLMTCISINTAANILAVFTVASPSHHIWNSPLVVALATRGHNVTVLSPQAQKNPVPNLTDLVMGGLQEAVADQFNFEEMTDLTTFEMVPAALHYMKEGCVYAMNSDAFQKLMNYPPETKFDLIIIESTGMECILGFVSKFGSPSIVVLNAFAVPTWMFEYIGSPYVPSHMPHYLETFTDDMTFTERVKNFLITIYTYYHYHYIYLPNMDRIAAATFDLKIPSVYEILKNVSLGMANFHPALDYSWAMSPNLIPVAGIHIRDPKPLPNDLQTFLDEANEGAIFFSLGSNVRSDKLPEKKRQAILAAFAQLPQRVLWKFESDLKDIPKNVKVGKWLPQNDILAHSNIRVFLTHSGLLSTHEAIYRGVPVVGIPFIIDQHINVRRMVNHGCGLLLEYKHLTKETLLNALQEVIKNSSYRENVRALSARLRDDPQTPLERAVFWTEYVLRNQGAPHLKTAANNLNIAQYFLLDVIAFLLAVPTFSIIILYYLCCRRRHSPKGKEKQT